MIAVEIQCYNDLAQELRAALELSHGRHNCDTASYPSGACVSHTHGIRIAASIVSVQAAIKRLRERGFVFQSLYLIDCSTVITSYTDIFWYAWIKNYPLPEGGRKWLIA